MTRVGIAGIWQETNTYSPRPTRWDDFAAYELLEGETILERHAGTRSVIGGFIDGCDHDLVGVFSAGAWPAGTASVQTADRLLGQLGEALRSHGSLDGLLVNLHGAMVTEGHPDMEADTLQVIREAVGELPVVCVLDLHANPSVELIELADVVIAYDTYPHVDMHERGVEAAGLLHRILSGESLRTRIGKHPLLVTPLAQGTGSEPMAGLIERARQTAERLEVDRVCITPGFPYSDVDRAGMSVLATATADRSRAADDLIAFVLDDIDRIADQFEVIRDDPATAVAKAIAAEDFPVVLADVADNIGGGTPGDGTVLLAELLAAGAEGVLSIIADPEVAAAAHRVGIGGTLTGDVGGKTDRLHGSPVPITGTVVMLSDGRFRTEGSWGTGQEFSMGATAWLAVNGIDLVVTEIPTPPFHVEQVTHLGIDPSSARIITAKGALAWRAAYGNIARTVIEVDTPGACPIDVSTLSRNTQPLRYP
jgi:microcystin degradation protein MlrC